MVRKFRKEDQNPVMKLWLEGNLSAHPFVSGEYWRENLPLVEEQLQDAALWVEEEEGRIRGFIGLMEGFVAGIFVDSSCRSLGIGKKLLEQAKREHTPLRLQVYQKNLRAYHFYLREGFAVVKASVDEGTGEAEWVMEWRG